MNKKGSDGRESGKVYGVSDAMEVAIMVVTGSGEERFT